jgi:hypothetical protein
MSWPFWIRRSSIVRFVAQVTVTAVLCGSESTECDRYHDDVSTEPTRHFTPAEAEALLPELDRLLETAGTLVERLEQLPQGLARSAETNGHAAVNGAVRAGRSSEALSIEAELQRIVDHIQAQGVVVRDLRIGLIDFPSMRDGQSIFLCWKRGEPLSIEWWHPVSTGIAGRQRL